MKLIIENGGSKLDWIVAGENKINTSIGINIFDSKDSIIKSIKDNFSMFQTNKNPIEIEFYTTGITKFTKEKMFSIFTNSFPNSSVNIYSDMLAASRALFNDSNGIACILGTGSNCAYFNGHNNQPISYSLGYLLGDEGSGYDLGKQFLIHYFQKNLSHNTVKDFESQIQMNTNELLTSIYNSKKPKYYIASFAKYLKKYEDDTKVYEIIYSSMLNFLENHPFKHPSFQSKKIGFVGSVAFNFRNYIDIIMKDRNLEYLVLKKPIIKLIDYYSS